MKNNYDNLESNKIKMVTTSLGETPSSDKIQKVK